MVSRSNASRSQTSVASGFSRTMRFENQPRLFTTLRRARAAFSAATPRRLAARSATATDAFAHRASSEALSSTSTGTR